MKDTSEAKIFCMALAALMFSLVFIPAGSGGSVVIGVKAGDWIKYDYQATGDHMPSEFEEDGWRKVEFLKVEGTTVTAWVTWPSDGHEYSEVMVFDVVTGSWRRGGQLGSFSGFVIPANSKTGDSFSIRYGNITIAGETTRPYAGARRTVVYADFHFHSKAGTYYWDKQTGVMVEASEMQNSGNWCTVTAKATETNMWEAASTALPGQWLWILVVVIVAVVVAGSAVLLRRRRKVPLPEVTPAPTE